jgi:hypothetical protein
VRRLRNGVLWARYLTRRYVFDRVARRLGYVPRDLLAPSWQRVSWPLGLPPLPGGQYHVSTWIAVPPENARTEWWLDSVQLERFETVPPYAVTDGVGDVVSTGVR